MSKNMMLVSVGVIALLAIGGGGYALKRHNNNNTAHEAFMMHEAAMEKKNSETAATNAVCHTTHEHGRDVRFVPGSKSHRGSIYFEDEVYHAECRGQSISLLFRGAAWLFSRQREVAARRRQRAPWLRRVSKNCGANGNSCGEQTTKTRRHKDRISSCLRAFVVNSSA